jgi:hypothetical protein
MGNSLARPDWSAAPLFRLSCRACVASFKIWNEATVGGNVCMSLANWTRQLGEYCELAARDLR